MKTNYQDPDARAIPHARKVERDNEWLRKEIGEATYLRSLMIMGIPLDEARMEFRRLEPRS